MKKKVYRERYNTVEEIKEEKKEPKKTTKKKAGK